MQLRFHCSNGNAQLLGDFLMLIALDVVEHKSEPGSLGERRDCAFHVHPRLDPARPCRTRETRSVFHWEHSRRAPLVAPRVLEHRVDRKSMQPRYERGIAAKRIEPPPRLYEDILQQLGRVGCVATLEAEAERVNAW